MSLNVDELDIDTMEREEEVEGIHASQALSSLKQLEAQLMALSACRCQKTAGTFYLQTALVNNTVQLQIFSFSF